MTREGWVFLIVFLFVALCSILRDVNLLIIVSGMMLAALLMNWRISRNAIRSTLGTLNIPHRIHVGRAVNFQWSITNNSRIPIWLLEIASQLRQAVPESQTHEPRKRNTIEPTLANVICPRVAPGATAYLSVRVLFWKRGVFEIGPTIFSTAFPLGLVAAWYRETTVNRFYVAPELGTLQPDWERRFSSISAGDHATRRIRGIDEDEFYALRPWRWGDSYRQIHWRATAKHRQPMVRQFDQESHRDIVIVLDLWTGHDLPGSIPDADIEKCELVLSFAATALVNFCTSELGKIGLGVAGNESFVFAQQGHSDFLAAVFRTLAVVNLATHPDTGGAIQKTYENVAPGTPCFVISTRALSPDAMPELVGRDEWRRLGPWIHWVYCQSDEFLRAFQRVDESARVLDQLRREMAIGEPHELSA
jgi:uncharacterized protein (DUF58 family)